MMSKISKTIESELPRVMWDRIKEEWVTIWNDADKWDAVNKVEAHKIYIKEKDEKQITDNNK